MKQENLSAEFVALKYFKFKLIWPPFNWSLLYIFFFVSRYTTTRFLAAVLSTRHFTLKCAQRRTAPRLVESLVKVPHETLQYEVFSTEDFKTSRRCFLDGTLQCCEVFSKKVHPVNSSHVI